MKVVDRGHRFSLRAVISTLVGETGDSLIFFPVAFGGLIGFREMLGLMIVQIVAKTGYEILVLPITVRVVRYIKRREGTDVFDQGISYNVLRIGDF